MLSYKYINKLFNNKIVILIVVILVIRALLNYSVPLMDKTEARYAEIARIMNETKIYGKREAVAKKGATT